MSGVLPDEPRYDRAATDDIQGNVAPGFNKPHQEFVFLRFGTQKSHTRAWLRWLAPRLASMTDVIAFRRRRRQRAGLRATWISAAFSARAIRALAGSTDLDAFGDESFRQGLAARSTFLGDPNVRGRPGHRSGWPVGGPRKEADALVIVAADDPDDLDAAVVELLDAAASHGLRVLFRERGATLPGDLAGHEHFGFRDGVSQPGFRGVTDDGPLTPRRLADDAPHGDLFAEPGQPLLWPGQLLLGEPRQDPMDPLAAAPPTTRFPTWARRGSYLVVRRLLQDVPAFWAFAAESARTLGTTTEHGAALMVGRWPSGAPLMRAPLADDAALAGDALAANHFLYSADTRPAPLRPDAGGPADGHRPAVADIGGLVCPHAAHIRRMNPRDSATDFGAPADTLTRLMARRGIPFGPPVAGVAAPSDELIATPRGLMFAAYMGSIEDQFEFVIRRWANSTVQPDVAGHDPIIGQHGRGPSRIRSVDLPDAAGRIVTLAVEREWVTAAGGGYFFAPPISAVRDVLGR